MLILAIANRNLFLSGNKLNYLRYMMITTVLASLCDIISFALDGLPGRVVTVLLYVVNSLLFIGVVLISQLWLKLLYECVGRQPSRVARDILATISIASMLLLLFNLFFPLVFSAEGNVYRRENFYWVYFAVAGIHMFYGLGLYCKVEKSGQLLLPLSVNIFVIPMIAGAVVQTLFYGISVIWVSIAVAMAGMLASIKNELIYIDQLTGTYNRYYLEKVKHSVRSAKIVGIMADLNGFKSINDRFGHAAGDEALIRAAAILTGAVGGKGKVIRYAGDEFIIILKKTKPDDVPVVLESINRAFDAFNEKHAVDYNLSVAMGYQVFDIKDRTMDEFMNAIDEEMYKSKRDFYRSARLPEESAAGDA